MRQVCRVLCSSHLGSQQQAAAQELPWGHLNPANPMELQGPASPLQLIRACGVWNLPLGCTGLSGLEHIHCQRCPFLITIPAHHRKGQRRRSYIQSTTDDAVPNLPILTLVLTNLTGKIRKLQDSLIFKWE